MMTARLGLTGTFDGGGGEDSSCRAAGMADAEPTELERDRTSKEGEGRDDEHHLPTTVVVGRNGAGGTCSSSTGGGSVSRLRGRERHGRLPRSTTSSSLLSAAASGRLVHGGGSRM
ncbi:hypothetical protein PIB30_039599 [Stylosanthes scabra]|uniref:Uncharacterized protein n=1 Tax=Stylosanthes scabra TaxID=79078 RepID=A0ABU6YD75_9FABA|nr:hypothetical protein [Stylosanthes scabra]